MLAALLAAGVVAAGSSPAHGGASVPGAPASEAFYQPPAELPGPPGTLVRSEPVPAPDGARAWRVLSVTRLLDGRDGVVSGIVVAPTGRAPKRGRPVVAWAHGTTGLADPCAPSRQPDPASWVPWLDELLAAGYVVTATDYQGLGPPGIHPYLVGESEGRSVLDTARAARDLDVAANRKLFVTGHSQGGHAALFAGEIAKAYAPELRVRAVAPGAPVSDVAGFLDHTAALPGTVGFLVMGATGYQAAYPELGALPLLTAAATARSDAVVFACADTALRVFGNDTADDVFTRDPRSVEAWARRLQENAAGRRPAGAPVLLWQGDADVITPEPLNATYVTRACDQGSRVDYRVYPGADHGTVLEAARDDVLEFFAARLRKEKTPSSC